MKKNMLTNYPVLTITAFMLFMTAGLGYAVTNYYVWRDNPSQAEPFTNWAMAATNIQAAVDRTLDGDTVYVTNGIYDTGGMKTPSYAITNRVCITKAITVCSMNGPGLTIIKGAAAPEGGLGTGAVRCVYLANVAASLIGFTLTGGYTMTNGHDLLDCSGGGVLLRGAAVISNCVISTNTGRVYGGGACLYGGTINNSTMVSNTAIDYGGGACLYYGGTLNNSMVASNIATGNGQNRGGGVTIFYGGTVNNCTLVWNSAGSAGGVYVEGVGVLNNCIIVNNTVGGRGGGGMLSYGTTLNNCTVVSNTATGLEGGGLRISYDNATYGTTEVNNCIVWGNTAPNYPSTSNINIYSTVPRINYTCSDTTAVNYGNGNIVGDPMFVDINTGNYRLINGSPCINRGTNFSWMTDGSVQSKDLDGHSRIDRFSRIVDMGCYEYLPSGTMYGFR